MILLIFMLEISAGIYAYSQKERAQQDLEDNVTKRIKMSYGSNTTSLSFDFAISIDMSMAVDLLQEHVRMTYSRGYK